MIEFTKFMIVILHNIRSEYNVGSIFRTADAVGIKKIYLTGITPAPIDKFGRLVKEIVKTALGAEKYIEWENVKSAAKLINKLKNEKYKIFAIEQSKKSISYNKVFISRGSKQEIALIVGNEVNGLPKSILNKADKILEIPMCGKKESLNVSVAFGIVAFGIINSKK
ncbi:RNA methyltransferase [Candidatus Wolfebacteria bacterium CG10_big_fil_rev_8_21_14_0_10_31_9]|uniref:RNA methyltransferase n=1 Tax=Candidatus Wolfebacteria bacterium CG10_big_fil_rev_8_21_14_0_10_31_9 TaxID=1975070 RepID=A0A2H0RBT8_9BACT|nr:MAG: RNA methyltransferase [Candidatus Wolfebacteria bacterium CG10_big_fil_rev_8_21_14_0_10_31_9]